MDSPCFDLPRLCDSRGKLYYALLALLRAALWDAPLPELPLEEQEWFDLFAQARRHKVQGVIWPVVAELPSVPSDLLQRWRKESELISARNRRLCAVADKQAAAWKKRGIRAVELKGRTAAAFYPEPHLRVCGDIDWWFPTEDGFRLALLAARENGCHPEKDSDGDYHYLLGGVVVEHHRHGLEADGEAGQLLLLNTHLLHHAMGAGIGLRHLCDLALALDALDGRYDRGEYLRLLSDRRLALWNAVVEEAVGLMKSGDGCGRRSASGDGCVQRSASGSGFGQRGASGDSHVAEGDAMPGCGSDAGGVRRDKLNKRLAAAFMDSVLQDGEFGLGRRRRFAGMLRRAGFFLRVAPMPFVKHWLRLIAGRLSR